MELWQWGQRMKKKELKHKRLREQMEAENPKTAFPKLRMSTREFTRFVVEDTLNKLKPLDKQYILEHPQPMDYYFTACLFLRNRYIANFSMHGGKFSDISCEGSDIFREQYSVELMQEIITAVQKEKLRKLKEKEAKNMDKKRDLVEVLHEAKVFYIATVNKEGKPSVRPFGAAVRYDGKVWICTGKWKNVYKQLKDNASIEIAATLMRENGPEILRYKGVALFEENQGAKEAMMEALPMLKDLYAGKEDQFAVFYLMGEAKIYAMDGVTVKEELMVVED